MKTFVKRIHIASLIAILFTATLTSCGLIQKSIEASWPLFGTYKMDNLQLDLRYTVSTTLYKFKRTTTQFPNSLLDFGTGTVTMGNTTYNYRHEKVNGTQKVVFVDQTTQEDVIAFTYTLNGNTLTLTSDNVITGTTARERAQEAVGWATIFGFGTATFPGITSANDASYGALIVNATK